MLLFRFPLLAWGLILAVGSSCVVALMARIGVLDHPGPRSSHSRPIPKGGGVGIVVASLVGFAVLNGPAPARIALALGGLVVAALGYWDDRHDFSAGIKFIVQYVASLVPVVVGIIPDVTRNYALDAAISVAWVLLVTNAVNFMDGLNGLSAGTAAIAAVGSGLAGFWNLTDGLIAGIAGFLPWNYPRARIFMGDVGSQFCGYVLAVLALLGATGRHPLLVPFALAGLLFDVIFTLIRRFGAGEQVTQAHRGHLYQIANRTGVPAAVVTLVHWGFAAWGVWLGLMAWHPWQIAAVLLPQIVWAVAVIARTRSRPAGSW